MDRPLYPSDLTDAQWELIEPLLPPFGESTFCETVPRREIVNGIRYVLRGGIQWRETAPRSAEVGNGVLPPQPLVKNRRVEGGQCGTRED